MSNKDTTTFCTRIPPKTFCNNVLDCVNKNLTKIADGQPSNLVNFCEATSYCINTQLYNIANSLSTSLSQFGSAVYTSLKALSGFTTSGTIFLSASSGSLEWTEGGGGSGSVTSVGLAMPSAFSVTNSPITSTGTITVAGAGTTNQFVLGDGSLGDISSITLPYWALQGQSDLTAYTLINGNGFSLDMVGFPAFAITNTNQTTGVQLILNTTTLGDWSNTGNSSIIQIDDASQLISVNKKFELGSSLSLGGDEGTSGYLLTSAGTGAVPVWTNPSSIIPPTPGIDDVLAVGQLLLASRMIEVNGNDFSISDLGEIILGWAEGDRMLTIGNGNGNQQIIFDKNLSYIIVTDDLIPDLDNTHDIGNSTNRWKDIYLSGGIVGGIIDCGGA